MIKVFDVVRSTVPRMDLDEAFVSKDEVGQAVLDQLREVMKVRFIIAVL